jgi:hypothetical protein
MGGVRFTVAAVNLVMERRLYQGRLSMLPSTSTLPEEVDPADAELAPIDPSHPANAFPPRLVFFTLSKSVHLSCMCILSFSVCVCVCV